VPGTGKQNRKVRVIVEADSIKEARARVEAMLPDEDLTFPRYVSQP
jgi:hypothetical protein